MCSVIELEVKEQGSDSVLIRKYSELDERMQRVAQRAIASINQKTSTEPGKNWGDYTVTILDRLETCPHAKDTLFVALKVEKVLGYVAFYTRQDKLPYPNYFLSNDKEAYCSWIALDTEGRGQGIGPKLQRAIFDFESEITTFKGHMKKTNQAAKKLLEKLKEDDGLTVSETEQGHQIYYSVSKN